MLFAIYGVLYVATLIDAVAPFPLILNVVSGIGNGICIAMLFIGRLVEQLYGINKHLVGHEGQLMRLAEIFGAVHYLRELCGAQEGQLWRNEMMEILKNEGTTAVRRAKLVNSFNDGYRGYRRTYRTCTQSATLATTRFSTEGATIASSLARGSTFASKGPPDAKPEASPEANKDGASPDANKGAAPDANTGAVPPSEADKKVGAAAGTEPNGAAQGEPAQGAEAQAADAGHGKHRHHKTTEAPTPPETQVAPQPAEAPEAPDQGF